MRAKFVNEVMSFERGQDPKVSLGIGEMKFIKQWLDDHNIQNYKINSDLSIDVNDDVYLQSGSWGMKISNIQNFPDYIQFNVIDGNFVVIGNENITSLRGFPKKVTGDFQFAENGINPSRKEIKEICDVNGMITKSSESLWEIRGKRNAQQKYLKLGPISTRASQVVKDTSDQDYGRKTYSRGYKTYKVLQEIAKSGADGLRYVDIIKFLYEMNHGKGTFNIKDHRGEASGFFERPTSSRWSSAHSFGIIPRNTSKNDKGRYIINNRGLKTIEEYKKLFNE
jgi:hypothetical protein